MKSLIRCIIPNKKYARGMALIYNKLNLFLIVFFAKSRWALPCYRDTRGQVVLSLQSFFALFIFAPISKNNALQKKDLRSITNANAPSAFGFLFTVTLFCLTLFSCSNSVEEAKLISSRANVKIEKGTGVQINYSDNGVVRIQASGATATRYSTEKPYLEFSDGIQILFFDANHKVESRLTAKYATAIENSKSMTARDSVVVVNSKGDILNTDELIWDEDKKIIYSNSFVKIATPDEVIYGNGMIANENFSDYTIKHITGTIKVKANQLQ